jgi:hypothetical protein
MQTNKGQALLDSQDSSYGELEEDVSTSKSVTHTSTEAHKTRMLLICFIAMIFVGLGNRITVSNAWFHDVVDLLVHRMIVNFHAGCAAI